MNKPDSYIAEFAEGQEHRIQCKSCNGVGYVVFEGLSLGQKLKTARTNTGLSLRAVEAASGISNAILCQYETGKIKHPPFDTVMKLCRLYAVSPELLYDN